MATRYLAIDPVTKIISWESSSVPVPESRRLAIDPATDLLSWDSFLDTGHQYLSIDTVTKVISWS